MSGLDLSKQELTARLQRTREEERARIAREIHDELGHWLTALKIEAFLVRKAITKEDKAIQEQLSNIVTLINETATAVGRIATELRPRMLESLGLVAALEWQGKEFEKRTGIRSQFLSIGNDLNPEINLSTNIFRVYQEALTNIARHASATQVDAVLEQKDNHISLIIKDNGRGFDVNEIKMHDAQGLMGMKERAQIVNGQLRIERNKPSGTVIILEAALIPGSQNILQ
jgi:signal transduction histidine kinase